jgi:hypothetical protein
MGRSIDSLALALGLSYEVGASEDDQNQGQASKGSFHCGKLERKFERIGLLLNKFGLNQANRHGYPYP